MPLPAQLSATLAAHLAGASLPPLGPARPIGRLPEGHLLGSSLRGAGAITLVGERSGRGCASVTPTGHGTTCGATPLSKLLHRPMSLRAARPRPAAT